MMKLKFDSSLEYQLDAIQAVVDVFQGQASGLSRYELNQTSNGHLFTEHGIRNIITLDDDEFFENTRIVQERNRIKRVDVLQGRNFSVEMETGTGKTYVYLRTIFELYKMYGFTKFIIVVPSVAIREGVLKSIDITKDHFRTLYNNLSFNHFVYDSTKLGMINAFARDSALQIMIINIQSFQRDTNIFNQEYDHCGGYKPKDIIASTNPIVIIDEPQSVDSGERSQAAIKSLEARVILRYSATHRNLYNLLYRLDPVRAYDLRLVKHIDVNSVWAKNNFNNSYVKLFQVDNKKGIKARLEIHKAGKNGNKLIKVWLKRGDDLFDKSNQNYVYKHGHIIQNIDCTPGSESIEFSSGHFLALGQGREDNKDDVMRAQIAETIKEHLEKERILKGKGIKVLSLFFIDRVSNYREYSTDGSKLGKIGEWFEEEFKKISSKPKYQGLISHPISQIHNGYFSKDKKGHIKDTTGISKDDDNTYNLIMKDKERLLSLEEPLRFIFSHSALREGWDNPNIFQICTLNETKSQNKKRQEIGRGLRLPVNKDGQRIHDENMNRLTIIANESYEDFAKSLQNEFEQDCGVQFEGHIGNARERKEKKLNKEVQLSPEFQELWEKIKHRTRYRVEFDTNELINKAAERIRYTDKIRKIKSPIISISKREVKITESGINADKEVMVDSYQTGTINACPDIVSFLQKETELTRHTLVQILKQLDLTKFFINPHAFMSAVKEEILFVLQELMIKGIKYEKTNDYWEISRLEEEDEIALVNYLNNLYEVQNKEKSLFDPVEIDSEVEEEFVKDLDNYENIKLFMKLPRWFQIDTPIGRYNPDWAFVTYGDNKLYFVVETKGTTDERSLRVLENSKIHCAKQHFKTIGVKYGVDTTLENFIKNL